jgi:hypothetical protein
MRLENAQRRLLEISRMHASTPEEQCAKAEAFRQFWETNTENVRIKRYGAHPPNGTEPR